MKTWTHLLVCSCLFLGMACAVQATEEDEYEEVVIVRRKKRPPEQEVNVIVAPAPVVAAPAQPELAAKPAKPKPPEPPAVEASDPRRLVRYFCKAWKDEQWDRMWWAMTPQFRKEIPLKKFKARFADDVELNGGLLDENISDVTEADSGTSVKIELQFKFPNANSRVVEAVVRKIVGGQYRLTDSAILPVDLNDL